MARQAREQAEFVRQRNREEEEASKEQNEQLASFQTLKKEREAGAEGGGKMTDIDYWKSLHTSSPADDNDPRALMENLCLYDVDERQQNVAEQTREDSAEPGHGEGGKSQSTAKKAKQDH